MLTLTSLARADRHMLLNAGNDVQRWWRLVYTVLTGMVELLRVAQGLYIYETNFHTSSLRGSPLQAEQAMDHRLDPLTYKN